MDNIKVPKVDGVTLCSRSSGREEMRGVLSITVTHLIFMEVPELSETSGNTNTSVNKSSVQPPKELMISVSLIGKVERMTAVPKDYKVIISTKHFRVYEFRIQRESDAYNVATSLQSLATPAKVTDLFAFHYKQEDLLRKNVRNGLFSPDKDQAAKFPSIVAGASALGEGYESSWGAYSIETEFKRMGVHESQNWKLETNLNKRYQLADTYPSVLVFPYNSNKSTIEGSAKFRSRGRLPVLTYLDRNGAAICRSSQPLVGMAKLAGARSVDDEDLCHSVAKVSPGANKQLFILDTRPKVNAWANKMQGKGYETEEFYRFIRFEFANIENVHVMRTSLSKITECMEKKPLNLSMNNYLTEVARSGWLKHIRAILEASVRVVNTVRGEQQNVLVHCSDGWDRTSQVCSVACLLMDPHYRTFNGLIALIEKDWLAFGHKFVDRCGFIEGDYREVSPIFTQFLDVIWQLMSQFPTRFEYNERLLLEIHTELYQCKYGTFLGNSEKERVENQLRDLTKSLWTHLSENHRFFMNPFYSPEEDLITPSASSDERDKHVLKPSLQPECFRLWTKMYNPWESNVPVYLEAVTSKLNQHNFYLIDHVKMLQKQVTELGKVCSMDGPFDLSDSTEMLFKDLGIQSDVYDCSTFTGESRSPPKTNTDPLSTPVSKNPIQNGNIIEFECDSGFEIVDSADISSSYSDYLTCFNQASANASSALGCSLSWDDFADVKFCPLCRNFLESIFSKVHCISCGRVFCGELSCIEYRKVNSVLYSQRKAPICRICIDASQRTLEPNNFEISVNEQSGGDKSSTSSLMNASISSQNLIQFPLE